MYCSNHDDHYQIDTSSSDKIEYLTVVYYTLVGQLKLCGLVLTELFISDSSILDLCQKNPDGIDNKIIEQGLSHCDVQQRVAAINKLLTTVCIKKFMCNILHNKFYLWRLAADTSFNQCAALKLGKASN